MEKYAPAEMEIVWIETEDVITASGLGDDSLDTLNVSEAGGTAEVYSSLVK